LLFIECCDGIGPRRLGLCHLTALSEIPAGESPPIAKGRGEVGGVIFRCQCNQAFGDACRKCSVECYLSGLLAGIAVVLCREPVQCPDGNTPSSGLVIDQACRDVEILRH